MLSVSCRQCWSCGCQQCTIASVIAEILCTSPDRTFFKPAALRRTVTDATSTRQWQDELLSGLESFWDSDAPRIGEPGATGWEQSHISSSSLLDASITKKKDASPADAQDPFDAWYQREKSVERKLVTAAKASDIEAADDDDPFRVVLFSDLADFLFVITTPSAKLQLAYAALNFLGLPFTLQESGTNTPFASDPYLTANIGVGAVSNQSFWPARLAAKRLTSEDGPSADSRPQHSMKTAVKLWSQDDDTVLGGNGIWFDVMNTTDMGDMDEELIR